MTTREDILRESRELLADRVKAPSPEDYIRAANAADDSMTRWKREGEAARRAELQAEADLRRQEREMRMDNIVNQLRSEFRAELRAVIEAEREFIIEIVGEALGEYGDKLIQESRTLIKAQVEKVDLVFARLGLQLEQLRSDHHSAPIKTMIRRAAN
jgi:hypothetical protein